MSDNDDNNNNVSRAALRAALRQRSGSAADSIADFNARVPSFMRELDVPLDTMNVMPIPSFLLYCIMLSHAHLANQIALLRTALQQKDLTP